MPKRPVWPYSVEKLLAHKFREIFTITTARTVSFFEVCCAKNNFGLPYVPKIFYFQDVGLEHGVFQQNRLSPAVRSLSCKGRLPAQSGHFSVLKKRCFAGPLQSVVEIIFPAEGSLNRTIINLGQFDWHNLKSVIWAPFFANPC